MAYTYVSILVLGNFQLNILSAIYTTINTSPRWKVHKN